MSPLFEFTVDEWTRTIDLRTMHTIGRGADGAWIVCWGQFEASIPPDVGAAIRAAWRAYHGTHAPAEPVRAPQLPEPWRWLTLDGYTVAAGESGTSHLAWVGVRLNGQVESNHAPADVVRVVLDAHRARGGA